MSRFTLSHARPFGDGTAEAALTIRAAHGGDASALLSLAALDSARPLTGERLVAELDGRVVAAVSLHDGRAIADPFVASATAVEMLRVHAAATGSVPARPRRRLSLAGAIGRRRPALA